MHDAGHCDCMAGFGETCSHVASLLWVVASGVQRRDSLTITDKSAYWVMPAGVAKVPFAEIRDISAVGKKRKRHECSSDTSPKQAGANTARFTHTSVPSDEEQRMFLGRLASLKSNRPSCC